VTHMAERMKKRLPQRIKFTGLPAEVGEERWERTSGYTLLFITAVFYLIHHNFYASVYKSFSDIELNAMMMSAIAEGNPITRAAYLAFGLYGVAAWVRVPRFRLNVRGLLAVILLTYLGWAVLSLAWSLNPMLTVRRLGALGLLALGITGLLRQYSGNGIVRLILFMTLSYLVIGVGAELALGEFTPWSSDYRFAGTLHPNAQGTNCAVLVLSAITLAATWKHFRPVLLTIAFGGLGFLLLTGSRTALAGCLAGLSAVWMLKTRRSLAVMTVLVLSCVGLLGVFLVVYGLLPSPLGFLLTERAEGMGVLSGRPDLWAILIEYARERPILGYGYGAFFEPVRTLDMAFRIGGWAFGGPHSVYLGTLVDIGAVGLACLLGVLFAGVLRSVRVYQHTLEPHYLFFTALLVYAIVDGFADATMISPNWHFIPGLAVAFLAFRSGRSRVSLTGDIGPRADRPTIRNVPALEERAARERIPFQSAPNAPEGNGRHEHIGHIPFPPRSTRCEGGTRRK
jgi:exopolysaccharide production protein ExoQ